MNRGAAGTHGLLEVDAAESALAARAHARRRAVPLLIVAALVPLIAVPAADWWAARHASSGFEAFSASANASAEALAVFGREQTRDDLYPLELPDHLDGRTVRRLDASHPNGAYRLFAVIAGQHSVCLLVAFADSSSSRSCAGEAEFLERGLAVATHARREGSSSYVTSTLVWMPDGRLIAEDARGDHS